MDTNLSIHGMNCAHCVSSVRDALARVPGVDAVIDVDLERGRAIVRGDAAIDNLIAAVTAAGFDAKVDTTGGH